MTARNTNVPFKGRIQKRKTNHLQIITFGLQRAAGPYRSAITGRCPATPASRTADCSPRWWDLCRRRRGPLGQAAPARIRPINGFAGGTREAYDKFEQDYWSAAATEGLRRLERRLDYDPLDRRGQTLRPHVCLGLRAAGRGQLKPGQEPDPRAIPARARPVPLGRRLLGTVLWHGIVSNHHQRQFSAIRSGRTFGCGKG